MATLAFLGAAQQVTGSCYLIETGEHRLLLECGIRQGTDRRDDEDEQPFSFDPRTIDSVIISHTHLDHSGMVPLLVKSGYDGPVYTTSATRDLLPIMYRDAASLILSDYERKNRRLLRAGKEPETPPYDMEDVEQALQLIVGINYGIKQQVCPEIQLRFRDAGHVLGSAIVELWIAAEEGNRKLVFSGDLGNDCAPLLSDPEVIAEADILLLESTYGERNHRPLSETLEEFKKVIETAANKGGNILIPSFAVGRTQDLIYWLGQLKREGGLDSHTVYIDSPMAIKVSDVYSRHQSLFNDDDPDFRQFIKQGWDRWLPGLVYTPTPEESMELNTLNDGAIIIAGSGMCTGGRILHHLKHNLWLPNTHVVIVGYQAQGTLGRALVDGISQVKIYGEEISVKAKIHTLGGFSAHAGQDQLIRWASNFQPKRPHLFLIHGEPEAMDVLQQRLIQDYQWDAYIPSLGEVITL
ncbi:MBL fold metallo-hydrolase [Photobacterium rosenbergii]|uniref:MBL fold metallo-hydrolase n=1 Tax=Photobacterium rosenbergii TaxID=294936 RepID=A0ABU3ZBB7_9GAMM|nr:MBL fold metallo-hydrolase [Photobacterium rosenbergii]MDV5167404.1 MBL fold metallo-hydrolase [Photobacterium rosenbergii]